MGESNADILMTRVIDRRASAADWAELEALASADPAVWRELALAQKDDAVLSYAVNEAVTHADHVDVAWAPHPADAQVRQRMGRAVAWSGWAAAAAVVLAVFAGRSAPSASPSGVKSPQVAGLGLPQLLDDYINKGKREGTVIGEMPDKVILSTEKKEDGRTEVMYLRQIVEKVTLDDLYRTTIDEAGNPQPLKIEVRVVGDKSAT